MISLSETEDDTAAAPALRSRPWPAALPARGGSPSDALSICAASPAACVAGADRSLTAPPARRPCRPRATPAGAPAEAPAVRLPHTLTEITVIDPRGPRFAAALTTVVLAVVLLTGSVVAAGRAGSRLRDRRLRAGCSAARTASCSGVSSARASRRRGARDGQRRRASPRASASPSASSARWRSRSRRPPSGWSRSASPWSPPSSTRPSASAWAARCT